MMISIFKNFIFFITLLTSFYLNAEILPFHASGCEIPINKNLYEDGSISYRLNFNNRKYVKNALSSFLKLDSHTSKKKWLKADLIVRKGTSECTYKTKIRVTGDLEDHYDFKSPPKEFRTSLLIRLLEDNIDGITSFKIFIPETRLNNNEILATILFKKLGFLSPRTYKINFSLNGYNSNFIFQEDITKEFLEYNNRSEGPILEGDERLGLTQSFSLSRVSNYQWIDDNSSKLMISIDAISKLNKAYLLTSMLTEKNNTNLIAFNNDPPLKISALGINKEDLIGLNQIKSFYALSFALNATHGLSKDDSRFYFNPVYGRMEPIYYDGMTRIMADIQYEEIDSFVSDGLINIKDDISSLDVSEIYQNFLDNGGDLAFKEFLRMFDQIKKNINHLLSLPVIDKDIRPIEKTNVFFNYELPDKNSKKIYHTGFNNKNHNINDCGYDNFNCNEKVILFSDIKLAVGQRLNDKITSSPVLFVGSNDINQNNIFKLKSTPLDQGSTIFTTDDIELSINKNSKTIKAISTGSVGSSIIFTGGLLTNWKINYSSKINLDKSRSKLSPGISRSGLTGCVSFHDIKLKNASITANNSNCEDGIHFLRASGNINKIIINNSISDGIDIDFSNLRINKIIVNNALNDCIDLSNGNYVISEAKLNNCGDKGVSVGESSSAMIPHMSIENSKIGIASKDSSIIDIESVKVNATEYCVALYRKKQEFYGAKMIINDIVCDLEQYFIQDGSQLMINKFGEADEF